MKIRGVALWAFLLVNLLGGSARGQTPGEIVSGLHLTGTVTAKDGASISNATVFIYTAGPRIGAGWL